MKTPLLSSALLTTGHLRLLGDEASLYALSGVGDALLLEKTPCFIWSADLQPMKVDKTLNTSDLLPTMLNLLAWTAPMIT